MNISIHPATFHDLTEVEKIHLNYYQDIGQRQGDIVEYFNGPNRLILLVKTDEGEVVAYLIALNEGGQSFAEWIGVKYENQKIGTRLVEFYIDYCKKNNMKYIKATTRNRFKKALIGYIKYGFEIYGTYQGFDGDLMIQLRKIL